MTSSILGSSPAFSVAVLTTVAVGGCASMDAQDGNLSQEVQTYTLTDDQVAIYNLAGAVEVLRHMGPDVIVEVRRGGDEGDALRVIYPEDQILYSAASTRGNTQVRVNDDGTFGNGGFFRGDRVRISTSGGGTEAWADLRILVPDGRNVAVYLAVGETRADGVRGPLRLDAANGSVHTTGTSGPLVVDTGSGAIDVRDAEGDVDLDTGSGSIDANGIRGARLVVDTGSGRVRGEGIEVGSLEVDTGSGSVRLADVAAPLISVETGSGSVGIELSADVDDLDVDTGSGSVVIGIPNALGADVKIRTGSGGIDAEVPIQARSSRRGRFEGVIGDGNGEIRIETGSGGVDLRPS